MNKGNLPHHSPRARGTTPFQMLRALVVIGIAAAGGLGVTLSMGESSPPQDAAAAPEAHVQTVASRSVAQEAPAVPVRIATAEPNLAGSVPVGAQADAPAPAPVDASGDRAAPAPQALQAEHAAAPDAQAPEGPDHTGTLTVASIPAEPEQAENAPIDLNTASFKELNSLRDAGALGRAIVKGRPYASVEDLVKRRIVRRSVYEKIKDQVTVR